MRILIASSELYPYSKTGGLADMVGGLARTLAQAGHDVQAVVPLYLETRDRVHELQPQHPPLEIALGNNQIHAQVSRVVTSEGVKIDFVDQPDFFHRSALYQQFGVDYPDNAERFIFFSKAVAHLALNSSPQPDIVHLNDWQTGLAALFIHHERRARGQGTAPATCMTLHNLAYQGTFPPNQYALLNLPWDYFSSEGVEFYGKLNALKAGIVFADVLTTVSPRYAREISAPELGCGLDGLLRRRQQALHGILNGVDYSEWNTTANPFLQHPYSAENLAGKAANKLELQRELGFPESPSAPLFVSVGRMVEQKGVGLMANTLQEMLCADLQFALLGTGESRFEEAFQDLARRFPGKAFVRIGFDEGLSHRLEAAADFFLMPSRFEPCGLNQLYSLRYGTVPVVRATGGLDDTVRDIRDHPTDPDGIKFTEFTAAALALAMRKAIALYAEPALMHQYRLNGMRADFSRERMGESYSALYKSLKNSS